MLNHFTFKHMTPSDNLRKHAEEKSENLKKYFQGKVNVTWIFSHEKLDCIVHCHLLGNQMDFNGEGTTEDFIASIDQALDKIEKQIRKRKEIVKDHLHKST